MDRDAELLTKARASILAVYEAFGRPGGYGYSTKEGKALAALYDLNNEIADELKLMAEMDAAFSEPLSAEEEAAVDRSWQRFKGAIDQTELLAALKTAKETIRVWHGPNEWEIYDRASPEMKAINSAIAKAEGRS